MLKIGLVTVEIINQQKPAHSQRQRAHCKQIQQFRMNAVGDPQQHSRFHKPSDRDPVGVESYGNRNRDEPDRQRKVHQVNPPCRFRRWWPEPGFAG